MDNETLRKDTLVYTYESEGLDSALMYIEALLKEDRKFNQASKELGLSRQALYNLFKAPNPPRYDLVEKLFKLYGVHIKLTQEVK